MAKFGFLRPFYYINNCLDSFEKDFFRDIGLQDQFFEIIYFVKNEHNFCQLCIPPFQNHQLVTLRQKST